jgi:drug/metabolite transporter (DMT)-like permease
MFLGLAWGLTMPMTKLAVSTGHEHFGIIFWQLALVALILLVLGRFKRPKIAVGKRHLPLLIIVALVGTIVPNSMSYIAAQHLPSGVISIVMSMIPMVALPIALLWGLETFKFRRLIGLIFGACAMIVLIGPEASLPDPTKWVFVLLVAASTVCYAVEGNYIAHNGLGGLGAVQVLFYSSLIGMVLDLPLAVVTDQFYNPFSNWSVAENALVVSSCLHAFAYAGYIWLVGRAGPIFSSQISYFVTIFGVLSAMIVLGERYSGYIWLALALVLAGLFMVRPRQNSANHA